MPAFQYQAVDPQGRRRKGVLEADTARQLRQRLRDQQLIPVEVAEVQGGGSPLRLGWGRGASLSATALALITRQLATLIGAGIPVEEALGTTARGAKPAAARLLLAIRGRVLEGRDLAAALADFPRAFPELFRATVAAGEQSGHLEQVLEQLADYAEARQALRSKVGLALAYPLLLTLVALAIVAGLLGYVVPQVVQVFDSLRQELPWLTRALIAVSGGLERYGMALLLAIVALAVGGALLLRRPPLRLRWQRLLLRLPLLGRLLRGINVARYTRTLAMLTVAGVPVLEALRIAAAVVESLPMQAALEGSAQRVKEGTSLADALSAAGYFPPMVVQLVASGEASGRLGELLRRAAVQQEREVETLVTALTALFEPLLILLMGGIVLTIVLAILLPIFELNQLVI